MFNVPCFLLVFFLLHYSNFNCDLTESVDSIMQESHELDGTTVVVDRATPKVSRIELSGGTHQLIS
jgi:hypothetical protein